MFIHGRQSLLWRANQLLHLFFVREVSRAYFWDNDPATQGPPSACLNSTLADVPLETIVSGNLNVK
jgi:hypothetical protein